jgi:hypothetical protein
MKNRAGGAPRHPAVTPGLLALVAVTATLGLSAQPGTPSADQIENRTIRTSSSARTPETVIQDWPDRAQAAARVMMEKYGQPDRLSNEALVWYNNGPWHKTVVYRKAWPHFPMVPDKDYLEQTIAYQVPNSKINPLKLFDQRIAVNKTKGELSCRSQSESISFLLINLADEIVTDRRSVEGARVFYRDVERLSQSGKSSPYMEGFLFELFDEAGSRPK